MNTPIYLTPDEQGFMGTFFTGNPASDHAVIIVGGMGEKRDGPERRAKMLASEGFNALALGWYNWKGLSKQAVSIPVDYCENAVHWLMNDCPVSRSCSDRDNEICPCLPT